MMMTYSYRGYIRGQFVQSSGRLVQSSGRLVHSEKSQKARCSFQKFEVLLKRADAGVQSLKKTGVLFKSSMFF